MIKCFYTPIVRWVVLCYTTVRLSVHLTVCLSVCPQTPFPHNNSKSFTAINLKPGIFRPPEKRYLFWSHDLDFPNFCGHKDQIRFPEHNCKISRAIKLKLGKDTHFGWGKIPIHFGVTGGHAINFGVTGAQLQKFLSYQLQTGYRHLPRVSQDAYTFWGHGSQFWGHWSITQEVQEVLQLSN